MGFYLYFISINQIIYENFRYRVNSRIVVYNRGCVNNFMEVFCIKVKFLRNNFRVFVEEEFLRVVIIIIRELEDEVGIRRQKVEDDLDIGDDFMNILQWCNLVE